MKKYSTLVLLTLVLMIVLLGNIVFKSWDAYAVEAPTTVTTTTLTTTPESTDGATIKPSSDYVLPYPGILPDHPLYFLKDFRDKIIEMLIVDPERKSEFFLLQSDKFLSASKSLVEKKQIEKAQQVLTLCASKMTMAVASLTEMKANGRQVNAGSIDKISKSIEKHMEVLTEISASVDTAEVSSTHQKAEEELMKLK